MKHVIFLILISLCCTIIATAQTSENLRSKYGAPAKKDDSSEVYELSKTITMTVRYSDDGQACELVISGEFRYGSKSEHNETVKKIASVLSDVAPAASRGKRIPNYTGIAQSCITSHNDEYEKVLITHFNQPCGDVPYRTITVRWKDRECISKPTPQPNNLFNPTRR